MVQYVHTLAGRIENKKRGEGAWWEEVPVDTVEPGDENIPCKNNRAIRIGLSGPKH